MTAEPKTSSSAHLVLVIDELRTFLRSLGIAREIKGASRLVLDLGLDSLSRVELIRRIERRVGTQISDSAIASAVTVDDLVQAFGAATPAASAPAQHNLHPQLPIEEDPDAPIIHPQQVTTFHELLQWHCERHPQRIHVELLYGDDATSSSHSYASLLAAATKVAARLQAAGLAPRGTVALMLPTGAAFLESFLGVLLAGGVPVPLYPPSQPDRLEEHVRRQVAILKSCEAEAMIAMPEVRMLSGVIKAQVSSMREVIISSDRFSDSALRSVAVFERSLALIQYTSGSTGTPKGVALSHANLLANIRAIGRALQFVQRDRCVSWLPLYHDMGLIGAWLGSLYFGIPLLLMSPLSFLARPVRWLETISRQRGTISAAPNFAYELCARRIDDQDLTGIDLSCWRAALNGAEPVRVPAIDAFCERFRSYGFQREAMMPVYGLAENSLAVTVPPLRRGPTVDTVSRLALEQTGQATPAPLAASTDQVQIVGAGYVLSEHEIRIVDELRNELPERHLGSLQFRGPSGADSYYRNSEATASLCDGVWRRTGDRAYIAGGELFIVGREKDLIIRAGRNIAPQDIEEVVMTVEGVRAGGVAAFAQSTDSGEEIVIVVESRLQDATARVALEQSIRTAVSATLELSVDRVVFTIPRAIPKTSSGKVRRQETKRLLAEGELGVRHALWVQLLRLWATAGTTTLRAALRACISVAYTAYALLLIVLLTIPILLVLFLTPTLRMRRRMISAIAWAWVGAVGLRPRVEGAAGLMVLKTQPRVIVVNHASYLDAIVLVSVLPADITFTPMRSFESNPLLHLLFSRIGAQYVARDGGAQSLEDFSSAKLALQAGVSVLLFPEGTFFRPAGVLPFRLGAFQLAAETGCPLLPLALHGTRAVLCDGRWFLRWAPLKLTVLPEYIVAGTGWGALTEARDTVRRNLIAALGEPDRG